MCAIKVHSLSGGQLQLNRDEQISARWETSTGTSDIKKTLFKNVLLLKQNANSMFPTI